MFKPAKHLYVKTTDGEIIPFNASDISSDISDEHLKSPKLILKSSNFECKFNDLPIELVVNILGYLTMWDVVHGKLQFLNSSFRFVLNNEHVFNGRNPAIEKHEIPEGYSDDDIICNCLFVLEMPFTWYNYHVVQQRYLRLCHTLKEIRLQYPELVNSLHRSCRNILGFKNCIRRFSVPSPNYINAFPIDVCLSWLIHDGEHPGFDALFLCGYSRLYSIPEIIQYNAKPSSSIFLSESAGASQIVLNLSDGSIILQSGWNESKSNNWITHLSLNLRDINQPQPLLPSLTNPSKFYKF